MWQIWGRPAAPVESLAMATDIRLRPVAAEDLPTLARFQTEPDAFGPFEFHGYQDVGWLRRRFEEDGFLREDNGWLIATTEDGHTPAGFVNWHRRENSGNSAAWCWNIGVAILPEHRARGIGTQAQRLLVDHLFATTPAMRVEAGTDADNVAEQRALERLGFQREGRLRAAGFRQGQWCDVLLYSRLRTDLGPDAQ